MNIPCFDRWSTTTRMEVNPLEEGSCSMKSMEIECHGQAGMGSCFSRPYGLCLGALAHPQEVQELT